MGLIILLQTQYMEGFKMNIKLKKGIRVILCLALTVGTYLYLCMIVTPKDINDSGGTLYYNGMGCLAEPDNSLDTIIFGNSDVYSGFSPAVLLEEYGYHSYASGRARQNVENINDLLKKTLKTQSPGLVILETDCFFEERAGFSSDFNVLAAPFIYHSRWKEIQLRDFYHRPSRKNSIDVNKGYISSNLVFNTDLPEDYMGDPTATATEIPQKNAAAIEDIIKTCKRNNIEVLFVGIPSPCSWDYSKHNAVQELAQKHKIPFVDMNVQWDAYGIDFKTDFRDNGNHLNSYGATKVSKYIGAYIKENYSNFLAYKEAERMGESQDV